MVDAKYGNASTFNSSSGQLLQLHREETVEIPLEPEVLAAICRRARRRLREIQASCQANLKLDRSRGVLKVTGTRSCISDVQKQLDSLSGPTLLVAPAVWAELMRTRKNPDVSQAAVARIQHETGCRIHIERNVQQVRLFGSKSESAFALQVFKEFECACSEETVDMDCLLLLDMDSLQTFAQEAGVTLQIEKDHIIALGIREAVAEAVNRLRAFDVSRKPLIQGTDSEAARLAIALAMAKLANKDDISCASTTADSTPPPGTPNSQVGGTPAPENTMQGQVFTKLPPPTESFSKNSTAGSAGAKTPIGACPTCDTAARFCFNCGNRTMERRLGGCPTCGTPNFCAYCGVPTERMRKETQMVPQITPEMESPYDNYMPDVQSMMQMPMPQMPLQLMQPAMFSDATTTMMPMPMQFVQAPSQASPMQQGFQVYPSASPDGLQTLMVGPACIMPMRMGL